MPTLDPDPEVSKEAQTSEESPPKTDEKSDGNNGKIVVKLDDVSEGIFLYNTTIYSFTRMKI